MNRDERQGFLAESCGTLGLGLLFSIESTRPRRLGEVELIRVPSSHLLREDGVLMSPATEQLLQAALALPEDERLELAEALLEARGLSSQLPFDSAWLPEIQRRSAEIDAGTVSLAPWSVVKARVRRRLEERSRG
jgi:putative addiction module component (TIGR02574 family)